MQELTVSRWIRTSMIKSKAMEGQGSNRRNTESDLHSGVTVCKALSKCGFVSWSRNITTQDRETNSISIFKGAEARKALLNNFPRVLQQRVVEG